MPKSNKFSAGDIVECFQRVDVKKYLLLQNPTDDYGTGGWWKCKFLFCPDRQLMSWEKNSVVNVGYIRKLSLKQVLCVLMVRPQARNLRKAIKEKISGTKAA